MEQALVGTADANGDRLRLMFNGIDRPSQFVDDLGQHTGEIIDHDGRSADLAEVQTVGTQLADPSCVPQQQGQVDRNGTREMAVVPTLT